MLLKNKSLIVFFILIALAAITFLLLRQKQASSTTKKQVSVIQNTVAGNDEHSAKAADNIPEKVYKVLRYVKANNKAPNGYVGGREFKNRERKLAIRTSAGRKIFYREWDVNAKKVGVNRGTERLVTGDDKRAWYTNNHYKTFKEVIDKK